MTRRLRRFLLDQAGFAMPMVMAVTSVVVVLAGLAVQQALDTTEAANQNRQVKSARQAADASFELAIFRLNKVLAGSAQPCVSKNAAGNLVLEGYDASGNWCPAVTDTLANGTRTEYRVSREVSTGTAPAITYSRKIVATGFYKGARRRLYTEVTARPGSPYFGTYGISARENITLSGSARASAAIGEVDVRANGSISMAHTSHVCGNITYGAGQTFTQEHTSSRCPGNTATPATTPLMFRPIDDENAAARTTNDNGRICSVLPPTDPCTNRPNVLWNPLTRELTVQTDATLTLSGNVYSLCRLRLRNSAKLFIAARTSGSVKIYFDKPENCPGVPTDQVLVENGVGITNLNTLPTTLQLFVTGSATTPTSVVLRNGIMNSQSTPMTIYAPNSSVLLDNAANISGAIAGKSVDLTNGVRFTYEPDTIVSTGPPVLVYQPIEYRECSPLPTGATPETGC